MNIFFFQLSMDNEGLQSLLNSSQTNQNQLKSKVIILIYFYTNMPFAYILNRTVFFWIRKVR